jgi:hypothetical protein
MRAVKIPTGARTVCDSEQGLRREVNPSAESVRLFTLGASCRIRRLVATPYLGY